MDSASGSLQSSSGGDDDYDSRPSLPAFPALPNLDPTPFTPTSPYLDSMFLSPDLPWPPRSTPQPADQNFAGATVVPPAPSPARNQASASQPRASKKRPRASRRAPTTVLTTDTTNFRQMVQEFTGAPTPPFSPQGIPRARVDYFRALEPPFLLRPFPQKLVINPNLSSLAPGSLGSTSLTAPNPGLHDGLSGIPLQPCDPAPRGPISPFLGFQSALQSIRPLVLDGPQEGSLSSLFASGSGAGGGQRGVGSSDAKSGGAGSATESWPCSSD